MFLQYQCLDSEVLSRIDSLCTYSNISSICPTLANPSTQYQQQWCEPNDATITCAPGTVINILCSYYGELK